MTSQPDVYGGCAEHPMIRRPACPACMGLAVTEPDDGCASPPELLANELAGEPVTYRQLDYWTRQGWIYCDEPTPGSGHSRRIPLSELPVIRLMAALTLAGLLPAAAARLARDIASGSSVEFAGLTFIVVGPNVGALSNDEVERG